MKSRDSGRRRAYFYGCTSYHLRGLSVCSNGLHVPMESTNRLVLDAFESDILRPEHLERVIRTVAGLQPSIEDRAARRATLRKDLLTVEHELDRLTRAITAGGDLDSFVAAAQARETRRQTISPELASLVTVRQVDGQAG